MSLALRSRSALSAVLLNELLKATYPFELKDGVHGNYLPYYGDDIDLPDGSMLRIRFYFNTRYDAWSIEFGRFVSGQQSFDITGGGDELRIFSTVIAAAKKFQADKHPTAVYFTSDASSRTKLYSSFAKRFGTASGLTQIHRPIQAGDDKLSSLMNRLQDDDDAFFCFAANARLRVK